MFHPGVFNIRFPGNPVSSSGKTPLSPGGKISSPADLANDVSNAFDEAVQKFLHARTLEDPDPDGQKRKRGKEPKSRQRLKRFFRWLNRPDLPQARNAAEMVFLMRQAIDTLELLYCPPDQRRMLCPELGNFVPVALDDPTIHVFYTAKQVVLLRENGALLIFEKPDFLLERDEALHLAYHPLALKQTCHVNRCGANGYDVWGYKPQPSFSSVQRLLVQKATSTST